MASTSRDGKQDGVEFVREDDGSVTAHDLETGLARGGDTRAEALANLAEVLRLESGGGDPITDPDEFLRTEMEIDPEEIENRDEPPEFLR
jgi:predicted RNase H-like HicB family nuclease